MKRLYGLTPLGMLGPRLDCPAFGTLRLRRLSDCRDGERESSLKIAVIDSTFNPEQINIAILFLMKTKIKYI